MARIVWRINRSGCVKLLLLTAMGSVCLHGLVSEPALDPHPPDERIIDHYNKTDRGVQSGSLGTSPTLALRSENPATIHTWPYGDTEEGRLVQECEHKFGRKASRELSLPGATVIITFIEQEKLADILHTLRSIGQRTPSHLLREIILVNDGSKNVQAQRSLADYVPDSFVVPVRIIHNERPLGLMKSRLLATENATSDVIVFMDAHMEVQELWLEPLLWEIKQDARTLATSCLDHMMPGETDDAWIYEHRPSNWKTCFDWSLGFGHNYPSPEEDEAREDLTEAIRSPMTVGGMTAIARSFFNEVGAYDDGMEGWGGENIDLSIRVWLFGGRVVNVPCSHVAHLERRNQRIYRSSRRWINIIHKNYRRLVDVWFDDYAKYFYFFSPHIQSADRGDISARLRLKEKAIHDLTWFLDHVYPELWRFDRESLAWGKVMNKAAGLCLWHARTNTGNALSLGSCLAKPSKVTLSWTNNRQLRSQLHVVQISAGNRSVLWDYVSHYNDSSVNAWNHTQDGQINLSSSSLCLRAMENKQDVNLVPCSQGDPWQQWRFEHYALTK